jgi:hypothetical protein
MGWKDWPYMMQGASLGFLIWLNLILIFYITNSFLTCQTGYNGLSDIFIKTGCWNVVQNTIIILLSILSFPFIFLSMYPVFGIKLSGFTQFLIVSAISLIGWGILIMKTTKK